LLRKYEVCGRLLFDGRGAGEYNGCIELVGKYGYLWGIFPANPFQLFTKFTHGFVRQAGLHRAVKKEKEEQT
jgi:hypothetical protein